jgi:hopene-associated glycosyltransferase HpnB
MTTLWVLTLLPPTAWICLLILHGRFWRYDQVFESSRRPSLPDWPPVAVIVPARNEQETIGEVLLSLLAQDYPGSFHLVLLDDRSTDATAARARAALAHSDTGDRATILTGEPLPAGWTGKLWAQQQGIRRSLAQQPKTEFFFFSDADIRHAPETLRALVAKAQTDKRDLVSLMARLNCRNAWERVLIPAIFFFQKLYPFAWANSDRSSTAAAAGGCVLIRRRVLEKIGGLAALRGALIDDCTLAKLVKRAGGRLWLGLTDTSRSLRVYDHLQPIWMMVARSAFTQVCYSAFWLAATVLGMVLIYLLPVALIIAYPLHGSAGAAAIGLLTVLLMAFAYRPTIAYFALPVAWALTLPAAALLYLAMTVDSARRYWFGQGSRWKGRDYGPRAEAAERGN